MTESYWQDGDLEEVLQCPACGSGVRHMVYEALNDMLEGVPGEWPMLACDGCGSYYLGVRPTPAAIGKAYRSYYTHGNSSAAYVDDNGRSLLWRWSNDYMNARYGVARRPAAWGGRWLLPLVPLLRQQLDFFYRHLPRTSGRLLDVGCGNGVFLLRAQQAGWRAKGLEPDAKAVQAAKDAGLDVTQGTLDNFQDDQGFDVITASHVIEHVHDPKNFLLRAYDLLRPGGRLWLATPNAGSRGHQYFGQDWRGLEPPRHLCVMTPKAVVDLLSQSGFMDIEAKRRGRGSRYILGASAQVALAHGRLPKPLSSWRVDVAAMLSARAAEEYVVVARKPVAT